MKSCPKYDEALEKKCEEKCDIIYEKYPYLLQDRYQENPQKLDEECIDAPSFTKQSREHTKSWMYSIFHWRPEFLKDSERHQGDFQFTNNTNPTNQEDLQTKKQEAN